MDGNNLRKLRKEKKITQQKLADYLNVDLTLIGKWELHNVTPSSETLKKLAEFFNVSIDYLLGHAQKEKPPAEAGSFEEFNQALESLGIADDLDEQKKLLKKITSLSPKQKQLIFQMIDNFKKDDN